MLNLPAEVVVAATPDHMTDLPRASASPLVPADRYRSYARKALVLIGLLSLFRLLLAFGLELGNDEAYYWMYSQHLKSNYFDHPPMVALLIRLSTFNGILQGAGWLRLGAVAGGAAAAWLLFRAVSELHSPRAGLYTSVLYLSSFYAGLTAGVYIMPDSPQMIFWTAALWMLVRIDADERNWRNWLLFGLCAGLAILSKVHAGFLWIGLGAYILLHRRQWLRLPQLYAAAAITAVLLTPIVVWNIQNDFITYRFHSRRVTVDHFDLRFSYMLKEAIGQLVFNNPVNVALIIGALWRWKRLPAETKGVLSLFCWIALPHAAFLLAVSLFRDTTLPHWSGPAYVTLLPLAAVMLAGASRRRFLPRAVLAAAGLYLSVLTGWWLTVHFYPGTYGRRDPATLGTGDISLDLYGWELAGKAFGAQYRAAVDAGAVPAGTPVVASYWWGAHVEYYFCRPSGIAFQALGPIPDVREYHWRNRGLPVPQRAFCILASDEAYGLPKGFRQTNAQYRIEVSRGGKPAHAFTVYLLTR
ncbi:ArnT family glycosyltransferase [Flaviaesturariibacter flavus]|nr:glycosyltransferase family 39 protein [Flaviaesturariibacter flavus]